MPEPGNIVIVQETPAALLGYATVPISFEVRERFRVEPVSGGLGGLRLVLEAVDPPWAKDYDAIEGEGPARWVEQWDIRHWGVIAAYLDGARVGGAAVAWSTDGVHMLEGRRDLAVLWDLRVRPDCRGRGVGARLFRRSAAWARERGCRQLKVETQNINVPACRFYAAQGCTLGAIHRHAYPDLPDEVELLWYLDL